MAIKDWQTHYPGYQDTLVDDQPDLANDTDNTRVSHIHTLRDKVDSLANVVGDDSDLPYGCLRQRVTTLEEGSTGAGADKWLVYRQDTEYTDTGLSFTNKFSFRAVPHFQFPPLGWGFAVGLWAIGSYGGRAEARFRVTGTGGTDQVIMYSDLSATEIVYWTTVGRTELYEPGGIPVTVYGDLRIDTSGDTAHMQYFEFFYIVFIPGGGGGGPG